jgi:hypothetical protein
VGERKEETEGGEFVGVACAEHDNGELIMTEEREHVGEVDGLGGAVSVPMRWVATRSQLGCCGHTGWTTWNARRQGGGWNAHQCRLA